MSIGGWLLSVLRLPTWAWTRVKRLREKRGDAAGSRRLRVTLVYLGGERPGNRLIHLDLPRLARRLNRPSFLRRGQRSFEFKTLARGVPVARDMTSPAKGELGWPDYRERMYVIDPLLRRLSEDWVPKTGGDDLVVGILRAPLTKDEQYTDGSGSSLGEDYYSRSDHERCAVVTASRAMLANKPKGKTVEQYVAYLIAAELLCILSRADRMHPGDAPCLFNDCVDREVLAECMESGGFCSWCDSQIESWGISEEQRRSIESILRWVQKDTWRYSVEAILSSPLKSLLLLLSSFSWRLTEAVGPSRVGAHMAEYSTVLEFAPVVVLFLLFLIHERYRDRSAADG